MRKKMVCPISVVHSSNKMEIGYELDIVWVEVTWDPVLVKYGVWLSYHQSCVRVYITLESASGVESQASFPKHAGIFKPRERMLKKLRVPTWNVE